MSRLNVDPEMQNLHFPELIKKDSLELETVEDEL